MKKLVIFAAAALSLVLAAAAAFAENEEEIKVMVNGEEVVFADTKPVIVNERTMIPIRAVAEKMGLKVGWEETTKTAVISNWEKDVRLGVDDTVMLDGDEEVTLDTPPMIIDGRTCLPVRAVAEAFGAGVDWDGDNLTVVIDAPDTNKLISVDGTFGETEFSYYYSDDIFKPEPTAENDALAVLSATACLCSYDEEGIKTFFENNGFSDIAADGYEDADTSSHKAAYTMAKKKIGEKTITAVAVRGTSGSEWYSNFEIYKDKDTPSDTHYGFSRAADGIYTAIKEYADADDELWLCGHSRGAAVCSLLAARLFEDGVSTAAYTFATPNCIKTSAAQTKVPAWNYVSDSDIITRIPLSGEGWDYTKNGTIVALDDTYDSDRMKKKFFALAGEEYAPVTAGQVDDAEAIIRTLAPSAQDYYTKQNNGKTPHDYFVGSIAPLLIGNSYSGLTELFDSSYGEITRFFLLHSGGLFLKQKNITLEVEGVDSLSGIPHAHSMEAYLSKLISREATD